MRKSFLNQFNEQESKLSLSETSICRYILENPEAVIKMPIQELAGCCAVVPSTIIKLSKKLGFSGYTELKIILASELDLARARSFDLESFNNAFGDYVSLTRGLIRQAMAHLSKSDLEKAAKIIANAKNIDIYSFGFDSVGGLDLYLKLIQFGKRVSHHENGYAQTISASNLSSDDVIIAISSTGAS